MKREMLALSSRKCRCKEGTCGHEQEEEGWDKLRGASADIYTLLCVK